MSRVIDHDSRSITASVRTRAMTLLTTPERVHVNARWAPITSLFRRLTSAPVLVRMKNATGIRCTWANTARRRSRITPSPIFADCHRSASPKPASAMATRPINTARATTVLARPDVVISSTTRPASTGVATVSSEPMTLSTMNQDSARRCGRAKARIRRNVCLLTVRRRRSPWIALSIAIQWLKSICIVAGCQIQVHLRSTNRRCRWAHCPGDLR